MSVLSSGLKLDDALRTIVQSLQLTTLLPAILLVGSILLLLCPSPDELDNTSIGLAVFAVITASFLFQTLNMPLIRLWEGYICGDSWMMQQFRAGQLKRFKELVDTVKLCEDRMDAIDDVMDEMTLDSSLSEEDKHILAEWKRGWRDQRRRYLERLEERFPPSEGQVMPTSLGNAIAAFERYPYARYRIDPIQLWTRFVPILAANEYAVYVQNEKAILDFLINMLFVSVSVCLTSLVKFCVSGNWVIFVTAAGLIGATVILFKTAVVAAANWGGTVKAAFDLYRHDLRRCLCLNLPEFSLKGERKMWQGISDFLAFNNTETFHGFDYALASQECQTETDETPSILLPGGVL